MDMRKMILMTAAFILLAISAAFSQDDTTQFINGLPVTEDDTARAVPPDLGPKNRVTAVPEQNIPAGLLKVLREDEQYQGWQDTTVYFEQNTGLYLVPVKYEKGVKIFGLTKNGNPVTYRESDAPDDSQ